MCLLFYRKFKKAQATIKELRQLLADSEKHLAEEQDKVKSLNDIIKHQQNIWKVQQKRIDHMQDIINKLNEGVYKPMASRSKTRKEDHAPYPEE